jgi:NAD/NADP transhydrogenase beta subunit
MPPKQLLITSGEDDDADDVGRALMPASSVPITNGYEMATAQTRTTTKGKVLELSILRMSDDGVYERFLNSAIRLTAVCY